VHAGAGEVRVPGTPGWSRGYWIGSVVVWLGSGVALGGSGQFGKVLPILAVGNRIGLGVDGLPDASGGSARRWSGPLCSWG
jgi:hypothetical protein